MLEFRAVTDRPLQLDLEDDGSGPVRLILAGDVDALSGRRLHRSVIDVLRRRRPARVMSFSATPIAPGAESGVIARAGIRERRHDWRIL